ncbi:MAG: oligosaccharide flippase family protein [Trueperaceae bacterium]|nr:oligosaccharide flippase family protein [Trueperaceae bacterium]MCO5174937.1 oligosaccharide flippase family protein [Trueperaceae bacterium]
MSKLAAGTAFAQLITLLSSPLLTRLFSASEFGTFALFGSVMALVAVVASLRYDQAIAIAEDGQEVCNTVALSLTALLVIALLVLLSAQALLFRLSDSSEWAALKPIGFLIPMSVLSLGAYKALSVWAIRLNRFDVIAKTSIWQALGVALLQVAFGALGLGPAGLILGQVLGQFVGIAALFRLLRAENGFQVSFVSPRGMLAAARRYRRFPVYSTWSALFSAATLSIPMALIAAFFGPAVAGYYSLGLRALQTPTRTVGNAISQVYLALTTSAVRDRRLAAAVMPAVVRTAKLMVPFGFVLVIASPAMTSLVFGPEWREAGVYMQWLAPWALLTVIMAPLAPLFTTLERQDAGLYFNAGLLILRSVSLIIFAHVTDPVIAIAALATLSALAQVAMLEWLAGTAGINRGILRARLLRHVVTALPFAVPLAAALFLLPPWNDVVTVIYSAIWLSIHSIALLLASKGGDRLATGP